jgi:chitin synthase
LSRNSRESNRALKTLFDVGAILCQASAFIIWPLNESWHGNHILWSIPASLGLISFGWWENYVDRRSPLGFIKSLARVKDRLKKTRYFVYTFTPVAKMFTFFVTMLFALWLNGSHVVHVFTHFMSGYQSHGINITQVEHRDVIRTDQQFLKETIEVRSQNSVPVYATMIQVIACYLAYVFAKFACKICIQGFSFAFPVMLSVPVTVVVLITACGLRTDDPCYFTTILPNYLYYECPNAGNDFLADFITNQVNTCNMIVQCMHHVSIWHN